MKSSLSTISPASAVTSAEARVAAYDWLSLEMNSVYAALVMAAVLALISVSETTSTSVASAPILTFAPSRKPVKRSSSSGRTINVSSKPIQQPSALRA